MAEDTVVSDDPVEDVAPVEGVADADAPPDTTVTGGEKAETLADAINAGLDAQAGKQPAEEAPAKVDGEESEEPAETDEQKAAREEREQKDGEKKPDHVNDPIPAQVSERTRERITSLVGTIKTLEADVKVQGDLIKTIQDTGATPEQFGEMISFMRDFNAQDMASVERAYASMRETFKALSIRLGKPIPEVDLVSDFPDLAQQLKFGQITADMAHELAVSRLRGKIGSDSAAKSRQQADQQKQYDTDKAAAITALNTLGATLQKRDGKVYDAKFAEIIPKLKAEYEKLPPSQWEAAFHRAYNMSTARPAPAPPPVVVPKKQQPIRPVAPAGGGSAATTGPKSIAEAISQGIDQASA